MSIPKDSLCVVCSGKSVKVLWSRPRPTASGSRLIRWGELKVEITVSYVVGTAPMEISTPSKECELRSTKSPRLLVTCGLFLSPFTCSSLICLLACYCSCCLEFEFKLACHIGLFI